MKEKRWSKTGKLILFCIALLFMVKPAISQIEDLQGLEMETDQKEVKCIPDTLTTHYDQLKEANVDPNQIGVWYSLAREEYKYKNYQRAIPY